MTIASGVLLAAARRVIASMPQDTNMEPTTEVNDLSRRVIGAAIQVHKGLGPGYQESFYEEAMAFELSRLGIDFERQSVFSVTYKEHIVGEGRIDFLHCLNAGTRDKGRRKIAASSQGSGHLLFEGGIVSGRIADQFQRKLAAQWHSAHRLYEFFASWRLCG
jgi:hypothetical protein